MRLNFLTFGDHLADPVTEHRTSVAERINGIVESAVAAEAAGFHGINIGEHHAGAFVSSSPPVTLAAIGSRTSTLRLGTAVTLIANLDPVRVAEDYAMLDVLSDGRAEVVVGRGNLFPSTYELFGLSLDDSRRLLEDNVELVLDLWTKDAVSWNGPGRPPFENLSLTPRPVQDPHPLLWIGGGGSPETAELAARLGLPLALPSAFADPTRFKPVVKDYRERFANAQGDTEVPRVAASWHMNVAKNSQEAKKRWAPRYEAYHQWFGKQVTEHGGEYKAAAFDFDWMLTEGSALCGSPAEVVDKLSRMATLLEAEDHLVYLDMGGIPLEETLDMIDLIGSEVIPHI
ncbi:LLM class flavin-dependent oxidoreductase [Rhodococcus koreensis]|uniref:LLM class flavin-dependent oxidoreductase n=1 Tax=Rhodococcus koreensis TaxID=99653 RepID=UPI00366FF105